MNHLSHFTNLYSLSKTLRFELKPVGNTKKILEEEKVFEKDETIKKKYEKTKPYFDKMHREFVKETLSPDAISLNFDEYFKAYKKWKADKKKYEKDLQKEEKEIRKNIVSSFDATAKNWTEQYAHTNPKKKDVGLLFEEDIFAILKEKFDGEEDSEIENEKGEPISIFDSWKGFTGYFTKFFETRRNFYKDEGKAGQIATRIVDQNLKRFCDNLELFDKAKIKIDFSVIEKNFNKSVNDIFSLSFYNNCLLQDGIDDYNKILGGETLPNGEKLKGINELINKYRQDNKGEKLEFLKTLDKQILSEKEKFIDEIESEEELHNLLKTFHKTAEKKKYVLKKLFGDFVKNNDEYNLSGIYISKEAFNTISHKWTGNTDEFEKVLHNTMKSDKTAKSTYNKTDDTYKFPDFIALSHTKKALEELQPNLHFWKDRYHGESNFDKMPYWDQFLAIFDFEFSSLFERIVTDNKTNKEKTIGYNIFEKSFSDLLSDFKVNQKSKIVIKDFVDQTLYVYQMAKYFAVEKKRSWDSNYELDSTFYNHTEIGYKNHFYDEVYEDIVQPYNKIRNYLTKKPFSEEKWKLNFENPTLAYGWDKNKESDNSAVILRKDGQYYLGLMKKGYSKIFDDRNKEEFSDGTKHENYEKIVYKFFPDQAKMFPKVCFSTKGLDFFKPSEQIYKIYKNAEFKKGETFSINSMQKLIDFYKDCLNKYDGWLCYDFENLKPTKEYKENIGEFYRDVAKNGYKISFQNISENYINEKNQNGELYLFKIHNKDWNLKDRKEKTGTKNLHTMYFESLFSNENIAQNFPFKLNGQAEIFYRPKTSADKLGMKKDKKGKDVINHKRYNENKIFFHMPLSVNRTQGDIYGFNIKVNNFLANNPDINVIGVDRGEKHLAYYSIVDKKGNIIQGDTLNVVGGIDYHAKLSERADDRERERKDWQEVEDIKNLKKGYISQVVHKLADLAIEHNAIIVFEDLNMRFKQIRGGIEKSVYQQLEKALIDKLNFLVNKGEVDLNKAGSLLKAYQLTAPFTSFKDMGKQTGILFYTQASYTSKIDPISGWRPNLYLKYSSAEKSKKDIINFSKIEFKNGRFEFTYDVQNFKKLKEIPNNTKWTLCSCVERYRWNKTLNNNKGGYNHNKDVTDDFIELFDLFNIDINADIKGQIDTLETSGNEKFFKSFIFLFNLICQIRNTNPDAKGNDNDFILSPVEPFFDSRKDNGKNLPKNGDDNGAYNIARKGLIILDKISKFADSNNDSCEKMKWGDLYVSTKDWDDFTQNS